MDRPVIDGYKVFGSDEAGWYAGGTCVSLGVLTIYDVCSRKISYGATDLQLRDRILFPYFFRTAPDAQTHYGAILKLLKYFDWNWVGIITSQDESGEREVRKLSHLFTSHGICIEFILKMPKMSQGAMKDLTLIQKSTSQVLITCGTCSVDCFLIFQGSASVLQNITIILKDSWTYVLHFNLDTVKPFNGSLSFTPSRNPIPAMNTLIHSIHPSSRPNDPLLEDIWLMIINCLSPNLTKNRIFQNLYRFPARNCSGTERIRDFIDIPLNLVYHAVYALAHALHNMNTFLEKTYPKKTVSQPMYRNKLHHYLRSVRFTDLAAGNFYFNERGEVPVKYFLINIRLIVNRENYILTQHNLGVLDTSLPEDQPLDINHKKIAWKNNRIPKARCNDYCPLGSRKAPSRGYHSCCYECVRCSEGEISSVKDSDNCQRCPQNEWPDKRNVKCIPKTYDFLSYDKETVGPLFTSVSILCLVITIIILQIFTRFRDTPIVRANNRTLSFLLLVSIMLSFLCVFLFLGCPVDITCKLRQTSFAIIFSIAVSSVLAKTIMVCIAFKATRPGSSWRKWIGVKVSNCVAFMCSSVQVFINVIWLSIAPPFQEFDLHSYPEKIIIQCNEGSVIAFYSVLGYMGFLAAMSFLLAFMVRTLPDSFNEAKYITFSMLVFCSVWISMIPAYLSTKGKDMVAVEIFAILASSAGLLLCIFFPKCYILLIKPEMNTRKQLLDIKIKK